MPIWVKVTQTVKAFASNTGHPGSSIPGLGRSPGEENGNALQYSCLENPMGRGAWQATVQWSHKESDTTEQLHFTLDLHKHRQVSQEETTGYHQLKGIEITVHIQSFFAHVCFLLSG